MLFLFRKGRESEITLPLPAIILFRRKEKRVPGEKRGTDFIPAERWRGQ